ncbi:hypothetical protein DAI22_02g308350 [Oryza sativa Japonica Group]|nr:hypothetical protein DAI22_02g308350 [Oryza sativa Japonica Group]
MAPPSFPSVDIFFSAAAPDPSPTQLGGPSSALPQHHHRLESAVAPIHLQSSLDPTASCSTACLSRQTGAALPPVISRRQPEVPSLWPSSNHRAPRSESISDCCCCSNLELAIAENCLVVVLEICCLLADENCCSLLLKTAAC